VGNLNDYASCSEGSSFSLQPFLDGSYALKNVAALNLSLSVIDNQSFPSIDAAFIMNNRRLLFSNSNLRKVLSLAIR